MTAAAREGARAATVDTGSDAAQDRVDRLNSAYTVQVGESQFCGRDPDPGDDAVIVVRYEYEFVTPLGGIIALLGGSSWGESIYVYGTGVMPCRA